MYLFKRLPLSKTFTNFMKFHVLAKKEDPPCLHHIDIDSKLVKTVNFIKDCGPHLRDETATKARTLYYMDEI